MTGGSGAHVAVRRVGYVAVNAAICAALLLAPQAARAATTAAAPYTLTFDSTIVDHFLGVDNGPTGQDTNEYRAVVPMTASAASAGVYQGTVQGSYVQATGEADLACSSNGTTGTTKQIEESGNPTTFIASFNPSTEALNINTGMPSENYEDVPGCGGITLGNTQPDWYSGFFASHSDVLAPLSDDAFTFKLNPGSSFGTLSFDGPVSAATLGNLAVDEDTSIVVAQATQTPPAPKATQYCVVPALKGLTLSAARAALTRAGCAVGSVRYKKSPKSKGRVLSTSPAAGAKKPLHTKVNLVVGKAG
jgi:PASTA domain